MTGWTVSTATAALASRLGGGRAGELAAAALVEAEVRGEPAFGLGLLSAIAPADLPARLPEFPGEGPVTTASCRGIPAPVAVAAGALEAGRRARVHGIGAVALTGVRGFGRLAPFARALADDGFAALVLTHAPASVAPPGGRAAAIGTNPVAFAVGRGEDQFVVDLATSASSMAALRQARAEGATLPEGTALDAAGRPTRSAVDAAILQPRGLAGGLLGLVVELLAGVATGARGGKDGRGTIVIAFDPARLGPEPDAGLALFRADWEAAGGRRPGAARPDPEQGLTLSAAAEAVLGGEGVPA